MEGGQVLEKQQLLGTWGDRVVTPVYSEETGLIPCSVLLRLPEDPAGTPPLPSPCPSPGWLEGPKRVLGRALCP